MHERDPQTAGDTSARVPAADDLLAYFREFLPSILGRLLIEDLETLSTAFEILVNDRDEPPWRLQIERGRLVYVGHEGPEPVCRFTLDSGTLMDVVRARVVPAEAFFEMRIELDGDMEMGLKLSTVLGPFFSRFRYPG